MPRSQKSPITERNALPGGIAAEKGGRHRTSANTPIHRPVSRHQRIRY